MNAPTLTLSELAEQDLRAAITEVERDLEGMALLAADAPSPKLDALNASWQRVVTLLKLGPAPEWRDCPWCRGPVRLLATRCVHCWKKSASSQ